MASVCDGVCELMVLVLTCGASIQAAVGNLPVTDVYLSPSTKKLLVRLADTCERSELKHILMGYQWNCVILCHHCVSG